MQSFPFFNVFFQKSGFVGSGLPRVKFGMSTWNSRLVGTGTSDMTFHWMGELLYHFFLKVQHVG